MRIYYNYLFNTQTTLIQMANLTVRFVLLAVVVVVAMFFTGVTSRSTVGSLDGVPRTPPRRRSLRFVLASLISLNFHSLSCCRRFWDLAYARAGVGLNPMPFSPVPSSSGSVAGSAKCPVISLSCHVRPDIGGGDGDLVLGRGRDEEV